MKIIKMNDDDIMRILGKKDKINNKEELIALLKSYQGILNDSTINYLNSLINLESSVIKNNISDSDRIALSRLEVYRKITIYNIYYKALNLFEKSGIKLEIFGNENEYDGLEVYAPIGEKNIKLFDFFYGECSLVEPYDYSTLQIGDISLFQTIESKEQREAELERVTGILNSLKGKENPWYSKSEKCGSANSQRYFETYKKIMEYEKRFKLLNGKNELTDEEKREIEITKQFHELLLEDYGLTDNSFEDANIDSFINNDRVEIEITRTLTKKMPNLNIENRITYI